MKINTLQTAKNIAENYDEHGGAPSELAWLLLEGHKGFNNMTAEETEKYVEGNCGLSKDSFPEIIVYIKESQ